MPSLASQSPTSQMRDWLGNHSALQSGPRRQGQGTCFHQDQTCPLSCPRRNRGPRVTTRVSRSQATAQGDLWCPPTLVCESVLRSHTSPSVSLSTSIACKPTEHTCAHTHTPVHTPNTQDRGGPACALSPLSVRPHPAVSRWASPAHPPADKTASFPKGAEQPRGGPWRRPAAPIQRPLRLCS